MARLALADVACADGRCDEVVRLLDGQCQSASEYTNLGISLHSLGRDSEAEQAYQRAIELDGDFPPAHYNFGNLLLGQRRNTEALAAFQSALANRPAHADTWIGLAQTLQHLGRLAEAVEALQGATGYAPTSAKAHANLGTLLFAMDRNREAAEELQHAIALDPRFALAHGNLGALLARAGYPIAAESACRKAIALAPNEYRWLTNLGVALFCQGRHQEAETCYRQALAVQPTYEVAHGNLLFTLGYRTSLAPKAVFAEYQAWNQRHAAHLAADAAPFQLDTTPGRKLRVGYVSPDFRNHAVAFFVEPLLAAHDRTAVEVFLYSGVAAEDSATKRFRSLCDHWRGTLGLTDAELAQQIRADAIDVLVDLAGHSAGNRLLAFAYRAAPVQVAYLVGHGYTTGLSEMDAFVADSILAPPGAEALFSERLVRLPRIPLAYAPPKEMPPVAPLPALAKGFITFGHFGRPERLNDTVIAAWARILQSVPGARLRLNSMSFQEPAFREMFVARFARHGIEQHRLDFVFTAPQPRTWAAYGEIDIALDPFPHNAGTTTIEALWQGVPVVSLVGHPTVGRFGASILHAVGLDDWAVHDVDAYVARAVAAAMDTTALGTLRGELRQRFAASALSDADGLARCMEAAYRALWEERQEGDLRRLRRLYTQGDLPGATGLANRMLARDPENAEAHHVLGLVAYRDQNFAEANAHLCAAITEAPQNADAHANHAAVLRSMGRLADAEAAARRALELRPAQVGAHNNLGNILRDMGRYDESADCYRSAVRLDPAFVDAWVNLAWVLALAGRARQAEEAARHAIGLAPDNSDGHNNLGLALMRQGRLLEAEAALRQALALRPGAVLPHSNILFCLNYRPDVSAEAIFAEYQRWDQQHARPLLPAKPAFNVDLTPARRLRVGYVSPDFRQHAVALFAEPLLAAHDRTAVELYCYAEVPAPDTVTQRFRALADHWRNTVGLSDAALAEQIRDDRIDVLVDLAGHTAGNRLLSFARKPAPVQVTYLLGHGYSSGLSAMDGFLSDAELTPAGADALFSEHLIRLSRIPLVYAPPADMPEVAPLPALANGFATFGYFGRTVRLNDGVLAAWAQLLRAVPGSRLMLNSSPFSEPAGCELMQARFAALGIDAARLVLRCTAPQPCTWAAYGEVDIALDPFPHNAGTTTIEALWQGVPVVTLAGRPTVGRFGAAILRAVGLDDCIASDVEAYVAKVVRLASNLPALAELRAALRPRFAASPLRDAAGLAREIEAAYRTLWNAWSEGDAAGLHAQGVARFDQGDPTAAVQLLRRSLDIHADAGVLSDLGVALCAQGRLAEAEAAYREALRLAPNSVHALGNLGNVLLDQRRADEAAEVLSKAIACAPDQPWLLRNLALSEIARGASDRAEALLRQALAIDPREAEAHETLAAVLGRSGRPIEAEAHHRAALPQLAQRHRTLTNLAITLQAQCRYAEAERCCREALAECPEHASAWSNLLYSLNYRADLAPDAILAAYREWDRQCAAPLAPGHASYAADSSPHRRLRVGYVSADFRRHSVAWFAEPLLAAHDRSSIELSCYADVAVPDAVTQRFRALSDHWRDIAGVSDAAVAETIRRDGIDVLVDLTGHTSGSRLLVFARRPAPVQVAYLLGHGYTSGLSAMDAFLADDMLVPPGAEVLFTEPVVRLPRIPLAYAAPAEMPPVGQLPALAKGCITFGYFGRPDRLNDMVVAAWARILHAVPGSRLVLNSLPFREPAFRGLFAARFATHGIQRSQLELLATAPQLRTWTAYAMIDIALDPFPHNAGTTTIEALWQGVPVVSLAGRPSVGRFGAMILHAVGMDDWVCGNVEDYVSQAVAMAAEPAALAQVRFGLRSRVAASPLCDAAGLACRIEAVYRDLWQARRRAC